MKRTVRVFLLLALSLLVLIGMAACGEVEEKPEEVTELTLVAQTAEDLAALEQYPNLQKLDLTGSTCYAEILSYVQAHPDVAVTYEVQIDGTRYPHTAEQLFLDDKSYDYDQLLERLVYLPSVTKVELLKTTLTNEQLTALIEKYPNIAITYSVEVQGQEYAPDTTQLDLSAVDPSLIDEVAAEASRLTKLTDVYLMKADGSSAYSKADVKKLMDALPGVMVHYTFQLFGKTITTADERVEYVKVSIGNEGVPQIREALDILPKCTYFKLDRCDIDDLTMEKLRDDYPNTKIVWRIFFAFYNCLTDTEVLRCIRSLDDENVVPLKYCTDVKYMDFGHNEGLKNFDFLNYMPKLEIVIVVDSDIDTLEYFGKCENLQWLEIVNCQRLTDLSPLANCKKLKGLNIAVNPKLTDVSPLYDLDQMERLFLGDKHLSKEHLAEIRENLPNTWVTQARRSTKMVSYNYSYGWRLNEDGSRADWYLFVRDIFRYDDNYFNHYNNDGQ